MSQAALRHSPTERGRRVDGDFAQAVFSGLSRPVKSLPCRFFYDAEGSALFDRICTLPEYYPTRTETRLLRTHAREITDRMGPDIELIEFGAGSLQKVTILLDALKTPHAYVPIDISGEYLRAMAAKLMGTYPGLSVCPIIADFTQPLRLPASSVRRVGFFPGSTIGNLDRDEALAFLRRAATMLQAGGLLIGIDLVKDPALLHAAYNDAEGVTARFNKNVLARANSELGADFDLDAFAHYAFYNPVQRRIEMHLMSKARQEVTIGNEIFAFREGETIHTENSYKYTPEGFAALARDAGFAPVAQWTDPERLFGLYWLEAPAA
ncbi:MAG: L-histidine N(alpha)-methyltransferase [Rhizomicrobium sp.]